MRAACVLALMVAAGCSPIYRSHGYAPSDEDLSELAVGVDTRDAVEELVGPPTSTGVMHDDAWYYVASRWQTRLYFAPEEIEREVVAVSFRDDGVVENVERFGLEDGQVVVLNRRVTDSSTKGISFIRQLLGNIGNVNAADALGPRN